VTTARADREDLKSTTYEFFILAVSILSIVNIVLASAAPFGSQPWWLIVYVDASLTLIFIIDFTYRLLTAPTKRWYLRHGGGVFDFLGCLPGLRIFRLFRILSGRQNRAAARGPARLPRAARGARVGDALPRGLLRPLHARVRRAARAALRGGCLGCEHRDRGAVGVALFATFSGFLANTFLSTKREPSAPEPAGGDLWATLAEVERLHAEQQRELERQRAQVAALEHAG
jgi:hypothetical protein